MKLNGRDRVSCPCGISVNIGRQHTHPFNGPLSGTTWVSQYQKGKTNLDFSEARDSEWQWHRLDHMQVCTSLQTDNHANTSLLSFLQAGCPSCHPTNSVKALKAEHHALNMKKCSNLFTSSYKLSLCASKHLPVFLMKASVLNSVIRNYFTKYRFTKYLTTILRLRQNV